MERDRHFGMHGYGHYGKIALFLSDLICTCMDICYKGMDIYYKVANSRQEVFVGQTRVNEKDGLEKIPEIAVMELLQGKGKDIKV